MRKSAKTETAKLKERIQALVREIVIKRDKHCVLRGFRFPCSKVLQAHHLISRGKNIGFADTRLIVLVCNGHHTAITFATGSDRWVYENFIRGMIGKERAALLDRAEADQKSHPMSAWDWGKVVLALEAELQN